MLRSYGRIVDLVLSQSHRETSMLSLHKKCRISELHLNIRRFISSKTCSYCFANLIVSTLVPKSVDYQFSATLDLLGQGIQNDRDKKRGEKGNVTRNITQLKVGST